MPPAAQEKLDIYTAAMKEKHGVDCDPINIPVDPVVIYDQFGGRSHGRYGFMDSVVPSDSYKSDIRACRQQASSSARAQLEAQNKLIAEMQQQRVADEQRWHAEREKNNRRWQVEREVNTRRMQAIQDQNLFMMQYMQQAFQGVGTSGQPQVVFTQPPGAPTTQVGTLPPFVPPASFPMLHFASALAASPGVSGSAAPALATNATHGGYSSATRSVEEQFVVDMFTDPFAGLNP